jgi:hypothetical protein
MKASDLVVRQTTNNVPRAFIAGTKLANWYLSDCISLCSVSNSSDILARNVVRIVRTNVTRCHHDCYHMSVLCSGRRARRCESRTRSPFRLGSRARSALQTRPIGDATQEVRACSHTEVKRIYFEVTREVRLLSIPSTYAVFCT